MNTVRALDTSSADGFGTQLVSALNNYRGGGEPVDDQTIIVIRKNYLWQNRTNMAQVLYVTLRCTTPRPDVTEMKLCESTGKNPENGIKYLIPVPERKMSAMALASGLRKLVRGRQ